MRFDEVEKPWEKVRELLVKYFNIPNDDYTISDDGIITVNTDCALLRANIHYNILKLPVKFSIVKGTLILSESYISTLEGCPIETGNSFLCNHTDITSLAGGPKIVKGDYEVINCAIKSLDGLPNEVWGEFVMTYNGWAKKLPLLKLLSIKHLKNITFEPPDDDALLVSSILNKYLDNPIKGAILKCAAELTKAGFKENARR